MLELLGSNKSPDIYENMETHQLEQLLQEDVQSTEQGLDTATLTHITGILAKRKKTPAPAWDQFQKHYLPDRTPPEDKARKKLFRRQIAAAVAVVLMLLTIPPVSNADEYGYLRGHRGVWDQDNLWFEWAWGKCPDGQKYRLEELSLEELQKMGCCPTWFPKSFEIYDRRDHKLAGLERVCFELYNEDLDLLIEVNEADGQNGGVWPVNGDSVQRYYHHGRTYYFFRNNDRYGACWIVDGLECYVGGMVSMRDVKKMVHSLK